MVFLIGIIFTGSLISDLGVFILSLPKNERVSVDTVTYMKGWIYGQPFSGKTTFLDAAPDPLNLNTDGNTKFVTMQRLLLRDEITKTGRMIKRKFAWEIFKETIDELEQGCDFKTIIIDLVEDTREMCRLYMYNSLDIQHESDAGYGKGWDIIKTEYLSTMRRLLSLDYNIFLVSHEDISKDLSKKNGDKITRIGPNIPEAIALKLAGMVDFVARVVVEDNGSRILSFNANDVVFGGGRLKALWGKEVPLKWENLVKAYDEARRDYAGKTVTKQETVEAPETVEANEEIHKIESSAEIGTIEDDILVMNDPEAAAATGTTKSSTETVETERPRRRRKVRE